MDPASQTAEERTRALTRRLFLKDSALGLGSIALGGLLARDGVAAPLARGREEGWSPGRTHFPPRAKRVVFLHMAGAPSQLDLFDPKPVLKRYDGQPCPEELLKNQRFAFIKGVPKMLGSPHEFAPRGRSGQMISSLLPHLHGVADDIAIVRSMWTEQFNHAPGQVFLHSGHGRIGRPSMGAWLSWGLGSMNEDLPTYVVLLSGQYNPDGGAALWSPGFLPTVHQGVRLRSEGDPVLFLSDPPGIDREGRRNALDAIAALNRERSSAVKDPEIETRIAQYELAFRMQASVPDLADLSSESPETLAMYGVEPGVKSFAKNCLLARRLLERGVRYVQLHHWGWDTHGNEQQFDILTGLGNVCQATDQACAALVADLKRLGLLEDTIVVWGGEFGRTPMNEERDGSKFLGRDHHPHGFTLWLAGGGFKAGFAWGATDELGYHVAEGKVSVHDLQATILHQLGLDHTRLTFRSQGRDFRLTDVFGEVQTQLLA